MGLFDVDIASHGALRGAQWMQSQWSISTDGGSSGKKRGMQADPSASMPSKRSKALPVSAQKQQEASNDLKSSSASKHSKKKKKDTVKKGKDTKKDTRPMPESTSKSTTTTQPPPPPTATTTKSTKLQQQMAQRLEGGRFRFINEQLYTQPGDVAFTQFQQDPTLFQAYHRGFRAQVEHWPTNPLSAYIQDLATVSAGPLCVVDLGCGEAGLARSVMKAPFRGRVVKPGLVEDTSRGVRVWSVDLVGSEDGVVVAANMGRTGLVSGCADWAVFCLALMGTDWLGFIREASRLLKQGYVAERFVMLVY